MKRSVLRILAASLLLASCVQTSPTTEPALQPGPTPSPIIEPTYTQVTSGPETVEVDPTSEPSPSPSPVIPTLTTRPDPPEPYLTFDGWEVYTSQDGSYAFSYPLEAKITTKGVRGVPGGDKPENMSFEEYFAYLESVLPGDMCVRVDLAIGFLTIQSPAGAKYANPCGVTGVGDYEVVTKLEEIQVGGELVEADKYEIYEEQGGVFRDEFYFLRLPGGYWEDKGKTYEDYLPDKETLLKILSTFRLEPADPMAYIPQTDDIIYTIRNDEPYSGQAGDPKPDWLGWGAQAFTFHAGEFWILDNTAQPQRVLRISPEMPASPEEIRRQAISLEGEVVGAADLEVYGENVWVLDIAAMPPRVVVINERSGSVESYDLPEGLRLENGLTGIALNPGGVVLVELEGGFKIYRLFDEAGKIAPKPDNYTFQGKKYWVELERFAMSGFVKSDRMTVEVVDDRQIGGLRVLGAMQDGSFFVEVVNFAELPTTPSQRTIRRYSAGGELLGVAYALDSLVPARQDLLVNPDGNLYQLVSNEDHSVQIVKLGFRTDVILVEPEPVPTPTLAQLEPLLPDSVEPSANGTDLEKARHALVSFFTFLHDGRYAEAAELYGGSYEMMIDHNPDLPPENTAALWEARCTHQTICMWVHRIVEEKQVAEDEFQFLLEFVWRDGTLFKFGPCCGATEAEMPPVWQFPYTVKEVVGEFKVMEEPVLLP